MLVPRITKSDNSIIKQMYKDWYVLRAVTPEFMYWDINQTVQYEEENQDKKAMYEKMKELKRDPVAYKELEAQALSRSRNLVKTYKECAIRSDKLRDRLIPSNWFVANLEEWMEVLPWGIDEDMIEYRIVDKDQKKYAILLK